MHVIPIAPSTQRDADLAGCHDDEGRIPKLDLPLARREFLKGTGVLMGTLASGSVLATLAPSPVWALELKRLSTAEGRTLMAMGRVLYPHRKLPDAVYALLVKDLDAKADAPLHEGLQALDRAAGGSFAKADAAKKQKLVKAIEGTPFFETVRGQCVTSLYDNDMAFAVLGYPGASFDKGGYITRGFQDLKWLPAPSKAASPPLFLG
ncbi:MAG TPA: twin-arginine translocation signal domain-containing protein [Albitalea sp.]